MIRMGMEFRFMRVSVIDTACLPSHNSPLAPRGGIRVLSEVSPFLLGAPEKANLIPGQNTSLTPEFHGSMEAR